MLGRWVGAGEWVQVGAGGWVQVGGCRWVIRTAETIVVRPAVGGKSVTQVTTVTTQAWDKGASLATQQQAGMEAGCEAGYATACTHGASV